MPRYVSPGLFFDSALIPLPWRGAQAMNSGIRKSFRQISARCPLRTPALWNARRSSDASRFAPASPRRPPCFWM